MARRELARISAPRLPRFPGLPREPRGWGRSETTLKPRGLAQANTFQTQEPAGEPPLWWRQLYQSGTKPEWAIYWALTKLGLQDGVDFEYQATLPGVGRSYWSQVDFLIPDFSLGIEVQGLFWHYTLGSERQQRDILRVAYFAERGIDIVFIDEDDALVDPVFYASEALQRRDHSKIRRGM